MCPAVVVLGDNQLQDQRKSDLFTPRSGSLLIFTICHSFKSSHIYFWLHYDVGVSVLSSATQSIGIKVHHPTFCGLFFCGLCRCGGNPWKQLTGKISSSSTFRTHTLFYVFFAPEVVPCCSLHEKQKTGNLKLRQTCTHCIESMTWKQKFQRNSKKWA